MLRRGRCVTSGIMHEVEELTQYAMWDLIDTLPVPKDYLQVFRLNKIRINGMEMQQIIHEQECPAYQKVIVIPTYYPVSLDVFVIDDGSHATMLLACEY